MGSLSVFSFKSNRVASDVRVIESGGKLHWFECQFSDLLALMLDGQDKKAA